MVYIAPGMRLVYRTDFNGMYNDVSQVVYFHYPQYHRQAQLPLRMVTESAIHCLPLVTQMLPDITVIYDDDDVVPGLISKAALPTSTTKRKSPFMWLVSCASIFLLELECPDGTPWRVIASPDASLLPLLAHILKRTGQSLEPAILPGMSVIRKQISLSAHSHVHLV